VRLAALDLNGISEMDLEGYGRDLGIPGSRVSPKSRVFSFCLMSPFCVNVVSVFLDTQWNSWRHYSGYRSYFLDNLVTLTILVNNGF